VSTLFTTASARSGGASHLKTGKEIHIGWMRGLLWRTQQQRMIAPPGGGATSCAGLPKAHPLLPGLWLESINDSFALVGKETPRDPTIIELTTAIVLDYPVYVQGLLKRLQLTEKNPAALLNDLVLRHPGLADLYAEHPLELDVQEEGIRKLVIMSCILAGAQTVVVNRPVLAELTGAPGNMACQFRGAENIRHVWQKPGNPHAAYIGDPELDMTRVQRYCEALEPYFRPTNWHAGRIGVAVGVFLAHVLGADSGQAYLALMTVFEALLSTDNTEITHQISERAAFMLESTEDPRYALYKRMKKLYKTRSLLVHGAIDNKKGIITYDTLRLDAKITVVPDQDYVDIFDLCLRLFKRVLDDAELVTLLERRKSDALNDYYMRLIFRAEALIIMF
jgi:hypothetical protein